MNVRRMLRDKLITYSTFNQFRLPEIEMTHTPELSNYLDRLKRRHIKQDPELLKFDSNLEGGNLDRVEAQSLSLKYVEMCRSRKQPVV